MLASFPEGLCWMATIKDLRRVLGWGALSAHDQWHERTSWADGSKRPADAEIALRVQKGGAIGGDDLRRFAKEYGVGRFPQYEIDADRRPILGPDGRRISRAGEIAERISEALDSIYRPAAAVYGANAAPPPDGETLASIWWEAIEAVRPHTRQTSRSLCKKTMWYYLPAKVTMWDAFAARGLLLLAGDLRVPEADRRALSGPLSLRRNAETFLGAFVRAFERLHTTVQDEARAASEKVAAAVGAEPYAFTRRVVDKALWFLGVPDDERRTAEIGHALRRYPRCGPLVMIT